MRSEMWTVVRSCIGGVWVLFKYNDHPLSMGDMFKDPQLRPKNVDHTNPVIYDVFSYTCEYIPMIKSNLYIRHRRRLTTVTNKIEQL